VTVRRQVAIPGILGGLGPLAHIELERRLLDESVRRGARRDADHPVWIAISASDIPDRTLSLAGLAPACTPWLVRYGNRLAAAGADFIVVPCNTAHAFYDQVIGELRAPWLHLIDETSLAITSLHPGLRRIGVLATDGTLASGVYPRSLAARGLETVAFARGCDEQRRVMQAIYDPVWGIKATGSRFDPRVHAALAGAHRALCDRGAEVIVAACTELSVAIAGAPPAAVPWIDPLRVLAARVLDLAFADPARPRIAPLAPALTTKVASS
jgi:aspartate racemase